MKFWQLWVRYLGATILMLGVAGLIAMLGGGALVLGVEINQRFGEWPAMLYALVVVVTALTTFATFLDRTAGDPR